MKVVSRGELRNLLQEQIHNPTRFRFRELPDLLAGEEWETLDEQHRGWYEPVEDSLAIDPRKPGDHPGRVTGRYTRFRLTPGTYDAFLVY